MTFYFRHITLLVGITTIIASFLFFGRETHYDILIITGLIVSTISFFVVLLKKDTLKSKLIWIVVVAASIALQQLTEPMLIQMSYGIFVKQNHARLTKLNKIVLAKTNGDILFIPNSNKAVLIKFTDREINEIQQLLSGTNISLIEKDNQRIFYRTFGMLDISQGVYYFYGDRKPGKRFNHISGNWYY